MMVMVIHFLDKYNFGMYTNPNVTTSHYGQRYMKHERRYFVDV